MIRILFTGVCCALFMAGAAAYLHRPEWVPFCVLVGFLGGCALAADARGASRHH